MIKKYHLKNGQVRYKIHTYLGLHPQTGQRMVIQKLGFKTRKEAEIYESRKILEYEENPNFRIEKKKRYKFGEIYELWFDRYKHRVKENTYIEDKKRADYHILPKFKKYYIDSIDLRICQRIADSWYETYKKAAYLIRLCTKIFNFGIMIGACKDNPMSLVERRKRKGSESYQASFYSKEELKDFFDAIEDMSVMQQLVCRVLAYTGLRNSELIGLQWRDIDEIRRTLTVNRTVTRGNNRYLIDVPKTKNSQRTISLDPTTFKQLMLWKKIQRQELLKLGYNAGGADQFIFTNKENRHLNTQYCATLIQRIVKKHNLPHITPHGFRHTHCSLLFEAGLDVKSVQKRLGHADISTTLNIYTHVTKAKQERDADLFADFMAGM
ncbi:tyrosine-type recombinase/integrase [Aerococcus sanguinicola]